MFRLISKSLLLPLCAVSTLSFAAQQGELSRIEKGSRGSVDIELSVRDKIRIYNLKDVHMTYGKNRHEGGNTIISHLSTFSVFRNQPGDTYSIRFTSANPGEGEDAAGLNLKSGDEESAKLLPYTVELFDGSTEETLDRHTIDHSGQTIKEMKSTVQEVSGKEMSTAIRIHVDTGTGVDAGTFTDTLTMVVSAE